MFYHKANEWVSTKLGLLLPTLKSYFLITYPSHNTASWYYINMFYLFPYDLASIYAINIIDFQNIL